MVTPGGEPRLEVKAGVSPGCEGQSWGKKKKKKGASVFFNSASCDERSVSTPPSTQPHPLLLSSLFPFGGDTVVKCNLGDRG